MSKLIFVFLFIKYILRKLNKPLLYFDSEVFIVQVIFLIWSSDFP